MKVYRDCFFNYLMYNNYDKKISIIFIFMCKYTDDIVNVY